MTADMNTEKKRQPQRACPICGKPTVEEAKPFCSRRCAEIDLGRWLKGIYAIPARTTPDEESEDEEHKG